MSEAASSYCSRLFEHSLNTIRNRLNNTSGPAGFLRFGLLPETQRPASVHCHLGRGKVRPICKADPLLAIALNQKSGLMPRLRRVGEPHRGSDLCDIGGDAGVMVSVVLPNPLAVIE